MLSYTVRAGDTLSSIARDQLGSISRWREIASLNRLASTLIRVGQVLQLPEDEIAEVAITQTRMPIGTEVPASIETLAPSPEMMQEVTVIGRRIDYTVLALLALGAWLLFGSGRGR